MEDSLEGDLVLFDEESSWLSDKWLSEWLLDIVLKVRKWKSRKEDYGVSKESES